MSNASATKSETQSEPAVAKADSPFSRLWQSVEPYVYLCFLGFLAFEPALSPDGRWLPTLLLAAVFIPIYIAGVRWSDRRQRSKLYVAVAAMGALAVVGVAFQLNVNSTIFLIFAVAAGTRDTTPKTAFVMIGLALAILAGLFFLTDYPFVFRWASFLPGVLLIPVIGVSQLLEAERKRHDTHLRLGEEEIKRLAAIAERERISRDLHDLLGHTLSTITLKSALAARLAVSDPARAGAEMREVEGISRDSLDQVREAVRGYRATGLAEEISGVGKALASADIAFDMDLQPVSIGPEQESALAMALREGATNVLRHSGATEVRASLVAEGADVVFTIADNGHGGGSEGNGLSGIRSRVQALGGTFSRSTDDGTKLTVRLPNRIPEPTAESVNQT